MTETTYGSDDRVTNTEFYWDEQTAIETVRKLEQQYGWTVCLFTRGDAESCNFDSESGDGPNALTDEEWDSIRNSRYWRELFDDDVMGDLWHRIDYIVSEFTR